MPLDLVDPKTCADISGNCVSHQETAAGGAGHKEQTCLLGYRDV